MKNESRDCMYTVEELPLQKPSRTVYKVYIGSSQYYPHEFLVWTIFGSLPAGSILFTALGNNGKGHVADNKLLMDRDIVCWTVCVCD